MRRPGEIARELGELAQGNVGWVVIAALVATIAWPLHDDSNPRCEGHESAAYAEAQYRIRESVGDTSAKLAPIEEVRFTKPQRCVYQLETWVETRGRRVPATLILQPEGERDWLRLEIRPAVVAR